MTKADARDKIVKVGIVSDVIRRWANGLKRVQIFDPILPLRVKIIFAYFPDLFHSRVSMFFFFDRTKPTINYYNLEISTDFSIFLERIV